MRRLVVSNMDVKRTFLETVESEGPAAEFLHQVRNFKIRGSSGKLNIALDGLPHFPAIPAGAPCTRGDMHVTDTIEMMERAYDDWKDGTLVARAVHRHADPHADRSDHGARRQALHVGVRAVLSLSARQRTLGRGQAQGLRRHRHRHHRAPQPGLQEPDPARRDPHAA